MLGNAFGYQFLVCQGGRQIGKYAKYKLYMTEMMYAMNINVFERIWITYCNNVIVFSIIMGLCPWWSSLELLPRYIVCNSSFARHTTGMRPSNELYWFRSRIIVPVYVVLRFFIESTKLVFTSNSLISMAYHPFKILSFLVNKCNLISNTQSVMINFIIRRIYWWYNALNIGSQQAMNLVCCGSI